MPRLGSRDRYCAKGLLILVLCQHRQVQVTVQAMMGMGPVRTVRVRVRVKLHQKVQPSCSPSGSRKNFNTFFFYDSLLTIVYTDFKSVDLHFENMVASRATRRRTCPPRVLARASSYRSSCMIMSPTHFPVFPELAAFASAPRCGLSLVLLSSSSRILQTLQRVELLLEEFLLHRDRLSIVSVLSCRRLMSARKQQYLFSCPRSIFWRTHSPTPSSFMKASGG